MLKYLAISSDVRNKILEGVYQANEKLPSEKELGEVYEASKMTVKKALDILVSEGLIIKRRGDGTFVKDLSNTEMASVALANQFRGLSALYPGKEVTSHVLTFEKEIASVEVAEKLNLASKTTVYKVYRLRQVEGVPRVLEEIYLPFEMMPHLTKDILTGSLYGYLEETLKLKIQSAHRKVTVRLATKKETELLQLKKGDPLVVVEQIGYLDTGSAFEYSVSLHLAQTYSVEFVLQRDKI